MRVSGIVRVKPVPHPLYRDHHCIYIRLVMSSYLLFRCIYFDAWCITCYPKQETPEVYTVIAYTWYQVVRSASKYFEVPVM